MLKLILSRHAESEMNKLGIHQGQLYDSELSPEGLEQAKSLAGRLKREKISKIYSSDLKRAFQTAKIVGNELNLDVVKDARLREFSMGDFDNFPDKRDVLFEEFYKNQLEKGISKYKIRPPNGENIWDFIKRVKSFLDDIKNKEGNILVVAHGGYIELAINLIEGVEKDNFRKIHQDNCCINEISFEKGKWKIISINDSHHISKKPKPKKDIYENQDEIKLRTLEVIKEKLNSMKYEAYLFGSIVEGDFGKYSSVYGRHKGSNLNVLICLENENPIPKKWKYVGTEDDLWNIYEIGKIEIKDIKHKIDFFIFDKKNENFVMEKVKELRWKIEKI